MKLVVTGGGTGGHIYPALAVAQAVQALPDTKAITYIGRLGGLESELVPQNGIAFEGIHFYGMPREKNVGLILRYLGWCYTLYQARAHAQQILKRLKPDVIFGTGGYVSAPVLMAANSLKIPYVVHEPDAKPGLVNQIMSKDAKVITTSFSEGAESLKRKPEQQVVVTGNPIRGAIGKLSKAEALQHLGIAWPVEQPILLVAGGSQGARRINQAVVEALPMVLNDFGYAVVHLTGKILYEETLEALEAQSPGLKDHPNYWVRPYSGDMAALLALADLAICRAGSLSLSEMAVCGVPTILVPYPFAAANHQFENALACVRAGSAILLEDKNCTGEDLLKTMKYVVEDPEGLKRMREAALTLGHPDATEKIVECLQSVAQRKA